MLGGRILVPDYVGLTAAGLNQANLQIPPDMPPGAHRLKITVGSEQTQDGVALRVQ